MREVAGLFQFTDRYIAYLEGFYWFDNIDVTKTKTIQLHHYGILFKWCGVVLGSTCQNFVFTDGYIADRYAGSVHRSIYSIFRGISYV